MHTRHNHSYGRKGGFTLIELLIVIGVIGILAAVVLVAVDPVTRIQEARDARRASESNALLNALLTKQVDRRQYFNGPNAAPIISSATLAQVIVRSTAGVDCSVPAQAPTCPDLPSGFTLSTAAGLDCVADLDHTMLISEAGTPTGAAQGTTGATSYSYQVTALGVQGETQASPTATVANGNATLTSVNFNRITWTAVEGAIKYNVYRTASAGTPATTGLIGTTGALQFDDTGLAGDSATPPVASSAISDKTLTGPYIGEIPIDPLGENADPTAGLDLVLGDNNTGYYLIRNPSTNRVTVGACHGEQDDEIAVTR